MPADFPYLYSAKNVRPIFDRIKGAGSPPKFTLDFLKSLGFSSSTDRPVIAVLKGLGFLGADGAPTERYNAYRDSSRSGTAIAAGLRDGWAAIFLADQTANQKTSTQLTELFKSVSGKGEAVAKKMATTFKALCDIADWSLPATPVPSEAISRDSHEEEDATPSQPARAVSAGVSLHHDVHLHLPPTSDLSVYTAIFRALKAELLD